MWVRALCVPHTQDWEGRTALWHAAKTGQYRCCVLLLERGNANPNYMDLTRTAPLMIAAVSGHLPVMQILIEKKANADQVRGSVHVKYKPVCSVQACV